MQIPLESLKAHVETFIAREAAGLSADVHAVVRHFAEYIEGKQVLADAVSLLTAAGYSVGPPAPAAV